VQNSQLKQEVETDDKKLRFAVMLQGRQLKCWQSEVIEKLYVSGYAEPVLLIFNAGEKEKEKNACLPKPGFFWRVYEKLFLRKGPLLNIDLSQCIKYTPSMMCHVVKQGKYSQYFEEYDLQQIRSYQPDFILRFGFSIIRGDILNVAPYGVWSFHHSDEQLVRGGPAGFWEVFLKHRVNGVILQRLTEQLDGGIILKKRFYKTILHDCAFHLHHVLRASSDMPVQVCADILSGNAGYFQKMPSASRAPVLTWPSNSLMMKFMFLQLFRRIVYNLRELFCHEKWAAGVVKTSAEEVFSKGIIGGDAGILHYKSDNHYCADPFAISEEDGSLRIFFEDYQYGRNMAYLSSVKFSQDVGFSKPERLTSPFYHRSFPFCFQHNGNTYIIPEQISEGRVDLYTWDHETKNIYFERTLLNEALADPVLFLYQGKWWLFGSPAGYEVNNSLNLYFSDALTEPFQLHPRNSIVFDPRKARMAGVYMDSNGKIFRFAQDSHIRYGKRIAVFEIMILSAVEYLEQFVVYIEPYDHPDFRKGLHTLGFSADYAVFDGKKYVFSPKAFVTKLLKKSGKR
jgi:hypothetical protein